MNSRQAGCDRLKKKTGVWCGAVVVGGGLIGCCIMRSGKRKHNGSGRINVAKTISFTFFMFN